MKKLFFILALIGCVSAISAQDTVYMKRESVKINYLQHDVAFSFGDGLVLAGFGLDDSFGSYSFAYHYGMKKWLSFGGYINYTPVREYSYDDDVYYDSYGYYDYIYRKYIAHYISLNVSLRFTYLNRPNIMLYSGTSLGFGQVFSKGNKMRMFPSGQMTFIGFSFGKKFYIGGEVGFGTKGIFNTNIGYHF